MSSSKENLKSQQMVTDAKGGTSNYKEKEVCQYKQQQRYGTRSSSKSGNISQEQKDLYPYLSEKHHDTMSANDPDLDVKEQVTDNIMPLTLVELKDKEKKQLLMRMNNSQIGIFFALRNHHEHADTLRKVIGEELFTAFKRYQNPQVIEAPDFVNSVLKPKERDDFLKLVNTKNFEAMDAWMALFGDNQEEYTKWKEDIQVKHPSINWSGELRKEIREKIKGVNLCARKDAPDPPSDVDTGAFRGRQQSYSKRMNKTRTSEERNHEDKIREQMEQLKAEKKDRNALSECIGFTGTEPEQRAVVEISNDMNYSMAQMDHNLNLNSFSGSAHLDSSVVDENLEDSFEHVHHSEEQDLTTEPIDKVEVLVEEKEITSDKLNKMKEEAVERLPEETNILLLGESGVGKSTFLNAFTNYMMYNNLEQADKIGVKLLTIVNYDFYDEERNRTHICEGPNGVVQDECDEKTKEPKIHKLSSGGKNIQLLDTPGIGDEEGIDKDDENFLKIMSALKEFESISAICILMPSNESKLSTTFRYCINELLNKLHSSLKDNIFFCFTRSRLTMYRFGDTIPTLRKLLGELKVDIPLGGSNLFSFDNECVRHLLAKKRGMEFGEFEESTQKESWEKSSISTFKLLEQIAQRNIVNLDKNRNLNEVRRFLEQSSKPLVEILKVHIMNKQLIEKKIQALENSRNYSSGPTPAILTRAPYTLEVRRLERPQMVCTSEKCTKTLQKDSIFKNEFNVCHRGCIVREPSSHVPHPELKFCREMENESCLRCGCSWKHHMHMTEEYEVKQQNISQSAHQSKKTQKNDLEPEIRSIDLEIDTILSSCAMFSSFILKNSLTGEHDSFKDHLDQTITEMVRVTDKLKTLGISEEQIKSHKEYQLAQELTNQKLVYQEKVSSFKTQNKDVNDITEAIENLKSLSDWESVVGITEKHRNDYPEKLSKEKLSERPNCETMAEPYAWYSSLQKNEQDTHF